MRPSVVTALLLAASPLLAVQAPPPPTPVFPERTDLVVVDVVVADRKGNPVPGLTAADFSVHDEKQPQPIVSFEAVQLPPPAALEVLAAPAPRVVDNAGPPDRAGRTFTIVFDNVHMSTLHAYRAKQAVASFLEKGVREGDRVSLLATGGGSWWSTRMNAGRGDLLAVLKALDGRRQRDVSTREQVTDFEAVRIHLYQDTMVGQRVQRRFDQLGISLREGQQLMREIYLPGVNHPLVEARAAQAYQQLRRRLNVTLAALERALRALEGTRGRKALVLVSEGFVLDPNLDYFKRVVDTARRSNVALYFVDTRGLEGLSSTYGADLAVPPDPRDYGAMWADASQDAEGAEMLAVDTGGFSVKNTNDLAQGIRRIARESESYYLLGYAPPAGPRDGRFRRIEVKVRGKGLVVRARRGYYASVDGTAAAGGGPLTPARGEDAGADGEAPAKPLSKEEADRDIQNALDSPFALDGVRLRMTAFVLDETVLGRARTLLAAEVDAANLDFVEKDGRLVDTLDVLIVAAHRDTGEHHRRDQKLEMAFQPSTLERLRASWYSITQDFELAPGRYQIKMVVRAGNSRKLGSLMHELDVPDLAALRISTPILTNTVRQLEGDPAPSPVLVVRRRFPSSGRLYCQFDVYGAQKDQRNGLPDVSARYVVREAGGHVRERGGPTRVVPTSLGRIAQLLWVPLEGMPPGEYELALTIRDELSGLEREVREPFTVTPAVQTAGASAASGP
ncbi:MAG TPA: VWA domain-containing protein [Vicinamibacteria bacterium]|nr:VWA domain-containing protein [Vicinamibacteria bacterium]